MFDGRQRYVLARRCRAGKTNRRDVGTVEAYWAAQMDLVAIQPAFNLYNHQWPIRTGYNHDPPAKFVFRDEANARVGIATESLVSLGCIIAGGYLYKDAAMKLFRVLPNGAEDTTFISGITSGAINALALAANGSLLVGGAFLGVRLRLPEPPTAAPVRR